MPQAANRADAPCHCKNGQQQKGDRQELVYLQIVEEIGYGTGDKGRCVSTTPDHVLPDKAAKYPECLELVGQTEVIDIRRVRIQGQCKKYEQNPQAGKYQDYAGGP